MNARLFSACAVAAIAATAVSTQAATIADANIFDSGNTVAVTTTFNASFNGANVVDGTNAAHVFADNTGMDQTLSISGFNSSIDTLRFFDTPSYSERLAGAVTVHSSTSLTSSLDPADYSLVGAFVLPGLNIANTPPDDVYPNPTSPADNPNPTDPAVNTGAVIAFQDITGLGIPAGTQSILLQLQSTGGGQGLGLSEIQGFAVPEPVSVATLLAGAVGGLLVRRRV